MAASLRQLYTVYDVSYLALAEELDAPLYTCDDKLAGSAHPIQVRVFSRTR